MRSLTYAEASDIFTEQECHDICDAIEAATQHRFGCVTMGIVDVVTLRKIFRRADLDTVYAEYLLRKVEKYGVQFINVEST